MPVSPCICCDCPTCTPFVYGTAYTINFPGTWADCGGDEFPCDPPTTSKTIEGNGCDFEWFFGDGTPPCVGGSTVATLVLFFESSPSICAWEVWFTLQSGGSVKYRKQTSGLSDPTGTYEVFEATGCTTHPATITVS